jgi:serine/threonine protein phosphatase PrpC
MWLEVGGSTDKGKVRSENQDAYCTMIPPVTLTCPLKRYQ